MRKTCSLIIVAFAFLLLVSCASSRELDLSERQSQVQSVVSFIAKNHPDPYRASGKKAFQEATSKLMSSCDAMEEIDYFLALQSLVSMIRDSHTAINFFSRVDARFAIRIREFDEAPILTRCPLDGQGYIGWEVKGIGGLSYADYIKKLGTLVSWDNEVYLKSNASGYLQMPDVMKHLGLSDGKTLSLELSSGNKTATYLVQAATEVKLSSLAQMESLTAPTAAKDTSYYLADLDDKGTLYFQYNVCEDNPDYPMTAVMKALKKASPSALIIDLRYNGGGDSRVLQPMIDYVSANPDMRTSVLVGWDTFSSAILNAKALRKAGARLYGEPTGGSANHYGEIIDMKIAEGVTLFCSTRTFGDRNAMGTPLMPDVLVSTCLESFKSGQDDVVTAALSNL
jgi:hypothetical protein